MSNQPRPLVVKLIDGPRYPLATLFYVWEQSRTNDPLPDTAMIDLILRDERTECPADCNEGKALLMLGAKYAPYSMGKEVECVQVQPTRNRLQSTINQILDEDIPCTENLNFVFAFENMPISLREQMVRHRIGVQVGNRIGIDIVPDLAESTWWSQTMRMLPMDAFFTEGRFVLPDSLKGKTVEAMNIADPGEEPVYLIGNIEFVTKDIPAVEIYLTLLNHIELVYNKLIEAGVPMEDARQIIPIGATHGITWTLNLKAMAHILGKRACWVAQANLWEGVIAGMVDAMCEHVHPIFRKLILPPCFKKGKYNACPYFQISRERVQGRDHMPPCPLYVYHQTPDAVEAFEQSEAETGQKATWQPPNLDEGPMTGPESANERVVDIRNWACDQPVERAMLDDNITRFERLWKLNVLTGQPLEAVS
jgi:thymidylate synthase ThyX